MWEDIKVSFAPDRVCIGCKIATARKAKRGKRPLGSPTGPGQILFVDPESNPYRYSLTTSTYHPNYFVISDLYSRYTVLIGTEGDTATDLERALNTFEQEYPPFPGYSFRHHLQELRSDAGSIFHSENIKLFAHYRKFKIREAAPEHQEQNGPVERPWQTIRNIAFTISTHARLGPEFFHESITYAQHIYNVLPIRGLFPSIEAIKTSGENIKPDQPTTPYFMFFNRRPRVGRYRVFGCPCFIRVNQPKPIKNDIINARSLLTPKNNAQRGVRGIFTGFPFNQAGYRVYVPTVNEFFATCDVAFDEHFQSVGISYDQRFFNRAITTRSKGDQHDPDLQQEATGIPAVFITDSVPLSERDSPWAPFSAQVPTKEPDDISSLLVHAEDVIPTDNSSIEEGKDDHPDQDDASHSSHTSQDSKSADDPEPDKSDDASQSSDAENSLAVLDHPPEYETTPNIPLISTRARTYSLNPLTGKHESRPQEAINAIIAPIESSGHFNPGELVMALQELVLGSPGTDPTPFLPEPSRLVDILRLPPRIHDPWVNALIKELKGLVKRGTFKKTSPNDDDEVVMAMDVYKCKLDPSGLIEKLKTRIVVRGDLLDKTDVDTWNPHASFLTLKVFLALCARLRMRPGQTDFIQAYLQAEVRDHVFVLPDTSL